MSMLPLMMRHNRPRGPVETVYGDPLDGGYYVGDIVISGIQYKLIAAAKADIVTLLWKTTSSPTTGTTSLNDGLANTNAMNNTDHPAAQYCKAYTGGGHNDWYLPARDELETAYRNLKSFNTPNAVGSRDGGGTMGMNSNSVPIGAAYTTSNPLQTTKAAFITGGAQSFEDAQYWCSTQGVNNANQAKLQEFYTGGQIVTAKSIGRQVRPFRKILAVTLPNIGDPDEGGFFAGVIVDEGVQYKLILAPRTSQTTAQFKTTTTADPVNSMINGPANCAALNDANHPSIQYCLSYTGGGFNDWYLPAANEVELIYRNFKPTATLNATGPRAAATGTGDLGVNPDTVPAGVAYTTTVPGITTVPAYLPGGGESFPGATFMQTSTVSPGSPTTVNGIASNDGTWAARNKTGNLNVRPVRRVPI